MLDAKFVRQNLPLVAKALQDRGETDINLDEFATKFDRMKALLSLIEKIRQERKRAAKEFHQPQSTELRQKIRDLEKEFKELQDWITTFLLYLPNIPHSSVPIGKSSADNVEIKVWGQKPIWTKSGQLLTNGAGKPVDSQMVVDPSEELRLKEVFAEKVGVEKK